eukprot:3038080-Amphidinium_carterae.1
MQDPDSPKQSQWPMTAKVHNFGSTSHTHNTHVKKISPCKQAAENPSARTQNEHKLTTHTQQAARADIRSQREEANAKVVCDVAKVAMPT